MDLQKIGVYIAGKRKGLGLTQRELAEKLGMSDKSVSKWERGVCLPDVSVYRELCGILGISLNEFFAGEDLDGQSLPERSEENLLSVSRDGKSRRKRLNRIIAALAAAALLLGGVLAWVLTADARVEKNRIVPFPKDSAERKTADLLCGVDDAHLFRYATDGSFREMTVWHTVYRNGELVSKDAFMLSPAEEILREGIIGLIPDYSRREIRFLLAGDSSKLSTALPAPEDGESWDGCIRTAVEREAVYGLEDGREYILLAVSYSRGVLQSFSLEDLEPGGSGPPDNDETQCFSVVFSKSEGTISY